MRVYLLKESDFERLLSEISRDPRHGVDGGSSVILLGAEQQAHDEAHRFYNYLIRKWIDGVKGEGGLG